MDLLFILLFSLLLIILLFFLIELFRIELNSFYKKIKKEIRCVVYPEVAITTPEQEDMISLAINVWRIEKGLKNLKDLDNDADSKRIESSVNALKRFLNNNNIEIIDHTGEKYNNGRNLEVYDSKEDSSIEDPIVIKTIKPSIISNGNVIKKGQVIIKK